MVIKQSFKIGSYITGILLLVSLSVRGLAQTKQLSASEMKAYIQKIKNEGLNATLLQDTNYVNIAFTSGLILGDDQICQNLMAYVQTNSANSESFNLYKSKYYFSKEQYKSALVWLDQIKTKKDREYYQLKNCLEFSIYNHFASPKYLIEIEQASERWNALKLLGDDKSYLYKRISVNKIKADSIFKKNLLNQESSLSLVNEIVGEYSIQSKTRKVIFSTSSFDSRLGLPYGFDFNSRLYQADISSSGLYTNVSQLYFSQGQYSDITPYISPDGESLYFASNRSKNGDFDIYKSKLVAGIWGVPERLPNNINTPGNEICPSISEHFLFFSSDFHPGFGKMDIFKSFIDGNTIENPINLGMPINSSQDDWNYSYISQADCGVWNTKSLNSSNIKILKHSSKTKTIRFKILDKDSSTPLPGAFVDLTRCQLQSVLSEENGFVEVEIPISTEGYIKIGRKGYAEMEMKINAKEIQTPIKTYEIRLKSLRKFDTCYLLDSLTKRPIRNAYIVVIHSADGEYDETFSDSTGKFTTWIIPGYPHKIILSKSGYLRKIEWVKKSDEVEKAFGKPILLVPASNVFIQEESIRARVIKQTQDQNEKMQDSILASSLPNIDFLVDTLISKDSILRNQKIIQLFTQVSSNFNLKKVKFLLKDFPDFYYKMENNYVRFYVVDQPKKLDELPLLIEMRKTRFPDAFFYTIKPTDRFTHVITKVASEKKY